ncbi:cysteine--tRNA ligase [Roseivirga sp. BDSF3-8]|uniref:cysteine--tRNA ligase n=1 Tax=Roseivirga sp. BDSF3-8 TaxID=3241598 RepID=UPI003531DFA4
MRNDTIRDVFIYNSLTRSKEKFEPINEGLVGLYVCGPTVYGDPHLGHARSAITFDIVRRYLAFLGYRVRHVRNVTDVGHLEDELSGSGEDRISKKAKLEKLEPMEIAHSYTLSYRASMDKLNNLPPSIEPTATGHIQEQIDIIEKILQNGYAYEVNGSVYFDLKKYTDSHEYGKLSGKVLDDLVVGTRETEGLDEKRSPFDFALWKKAKPEHIMRWKSPWSVGFPGWHLECTAMSTKYLGNPFDIHGGGMDLQFPHHEAEIAQNVCATGESPVNYWMHNNMVTIDQQKMAKSLGNFINLEEFFTGDHEKLEQAYTPMTVRFFLLQAHYRSTIDFSNEALKAAEKGYKRLMNSLKNVRAMEYAGKGEPDKAWQEKISKSIQDCYTHMSDDFNTARALASLYELTSFFNEVHAGKLQPAVLGKDLFEKARATFDGMITDVMGLLPEDGGGEKRLEGTVELLIELRKKAKEEKNYDVSDHIRDELKNLGIQLKDEKGGGTTFTLD